MADGDGKNGMEITPKAGRGGELVKW